MGDRGKPAAAAERQQQLQLLTDSVGGVIVGKPEAIEQALVCLLCRGHLLLEDIPGVGKTMFARALSASLAAEYKRIQFTPDLLPADVTGACVFDREHGTFELRRGPVFTEVLLADEINRASPRTQSSLLESMEERQVTIDGETHRLPALFFVVATQNPVELAGTFPLPEAQLDRFFMRLSLGYLDLADEVAMLKAQNAAHPLASVKSVITVAQLTALQDAVSDVHVEDSLLGYMARLVQATREHAEVQLGASPRGTLALRRASQALALMRGQTFVTPEQVKAVVPGVLSHRLVLKAQSRLSGIRPERVLADVLDAVEVPIT
jgi:MoxR-like ATPase